MKLSSMLAIYVLFWTLCLFVVLPFGVRTDDESGKSRSTGHADSAPSNPNLYRKAGYTTLLSAVLFAAFYANYVYGWLEAGDVPFLQPPAEQSIMGNEATR